MSSPEGAGRFPLSPTVTIVKEGLLLKKAQYCGVWRQRYFYLLSDGSFKGFTTKPTHPFATPINNNFSVIDCQIFLKVKDDQFRFYLKGLLNWSKTIVRKFYTETREERRDWLMAIVNVNVKCKASPLKTLSPPAQRKLTYEDFEVVQVIGRGSYGKVVLCRDNDHGNYYAMKILKKAETIKEEKVTHTMTECKVLQTTDHPFLLALKCSFQTADFLFFVTEFVRCGDLFFHLKKDKFFSEERTKFYAAEMVSAMAYLHKNKIIYRDLKLENVLLDHEGHIKLADFGLCKMSIDYHGVTATHCGSTYGLAPEIINYDEYGFAVDWWTLGIVTFEMLAGRLPFYHQNSKILYELILVAEPKYPEKFSEEACSLITGLLKKNPVERLGATQDSWELMHNPFFEDISWDDLDEKKIRPPFIPTLESETDTRYFDPEFTEQSVQQTPPRADQGEEVEEAEEADEAYEDEDDESETEENPFKGFSFVNVSEFLEASGSSKLL